MPNLSPFERDSLANKLLENVELSYYEELLPAVKVGRTVFTFTNILYTAAALLAAYSLFLITRKYWQRFANFLLRYLRYIEAFTRFLLRPDILPWELLLLSILATYYAPQITSYTVQLIVVHLALPTLWVQLLKLLTRKFKLSECLRQLSDIDLNKAWVAVERAFATIFIPNLALSACLLYLCFTTPYSLYRYELVAAGLITLLTAPFLLAAYVRSRFSLFSTFRKKI